MKLPKYYDSEENFNKIHFRLKLTQCPFCKLIGYLILHGYLKGYDENGYDNKIIRGHRIFCSNRKNRKGCGRTFSIILKYFIRHFIITAATIWELFLNIANGFNKKSAIQKTNRIPTLSSAYRLWRRFIVNQSFLKTKLIPICNPPPDSNNDPNIQTILHLKKVFPSLNPISDFQLHFQSSFFTNSSPAYGLI